MHRATKNWLGRCKFILHCFADSVDTLHCCVPKRNLLTSKEYLLISKHSKKRRPLTPQKPPKTSPSRSSSTASSSQRTPKPLGQNLSFSGFLHHNLRRSLSYQKASSLTTEILSYSPGKWALQRPLHILHSSQLMNCSICSQNPT